jgi:hypothetical protein
MTAETVMATCPRPNEDLMNWKIPAANQIAVLLAAVAFVAIGFDTRAGAQSQTPTPKQQAKPLKPQQYDDRGRPYYGQSGPNVSYQQGPHTRVFITKRSWLDAGVEVLPGDRKFTDYAFPPEYGYPDFARENKNRPIDRQPLNPASDMGGYPQRFPIPQ